MATVYGANYTKQFVNVPSEKIPKGEQYGRVHVAYDSYEASGAIAINTLINFMKLPAGARVIGCTLKYDDLGSAGVIDVGTSADQNAFINAADVNSAAGASQMDNEAGNLAQYSSETQVIAKVTSATTAAGTIELMMEYVVD